MSSGRGARPPGVESVSFDRASGYYDATRALPADALAEVTSMLTRELAGRAPCLEVGIGTGRIGVPLCERGPRLFGLDLSRAMLDELVAKVGSVTALPIVVGDTTTLPVRTGSVEAVLACHVLHLVPAWREAVDEALRVLAPGGVLLLDPGRHAYAPWDAPAMEAMGRCGVARIRPGLNSHDDLLACIGTRAAPRRLEPVEASAVRTLAADIADWRRQVHAWTWPYSPAQMDAACREVEEWARSAGWPLDEEADVTGVIQWWAFDLLG